MSRRKPGYADCAEREEEYHSGMVLKQLLGSVSQAAFMQEHFLRLPFALAGGCSHLSACGDWPVVEQVLSSPEADIIVGSAEQRYEGKSPTSLEEARQLLSQGLTVGIRHAERHDASLADLARGFATDFAAPIDIHLYCTPAGKPGFGWHYDAEDVFVLQTRGKKEWWLRKNTVNPWPLVETLPKDMKYEREIMPAMRCLLAAGDWLYIPAGYWHRTECLEESISLSVGIESPSAMSVFDFLRPQLLESLRWRQRLPPMGEATPLSQEELLAELQTLLESLGTDLAKLLADKRTAERLLKSLKPRRDDS
jgi:50S ribosomal protein L16 3-hydroxylase